MSGGKVQEKKYELVAPDGGWGYLIFVAFIINVSTATVFIGCFGMLFNDFMNEIGMNSTGVTLLTGFNAFAFAMAGFFTNSLLKLMSRRKLALVSALLLNAGMVGMIFAKSIATFIFCQGILPGISMGLTFNLNCSLLNDYFVKKRMFAFSFVNFVVGILTVIAPIFVRWSLVEFGYRGTVILIAGITFNNIFGVLLMQPVEWHMKRVEIIPTADKQPLLIEEKNKAVVIKLTDANVETAATIEKIDERAFEVKKPSNFMRFLESFIDVPLFKKLILSCVCLGPAMSNFAESTFMMILPQALYTNGWNQDMVALALSLYCFGDLAMRTVVIFISKWIPKVGCQEVFIMSLVLAAVSRLGMIWSEQALPIYIYITLMGVSRCFICILITVVISDVVPADKFTSAMGIFMLVTGTTVIVLGPAIGAIRDLTKSYSTAFYLLTSCYVIVVLFWSIELLYKRNVGKSDRQRKISTKSTQSNKGK